MGQVIKSFLGIFFAFLVVITGVSVVTMQMQVLEARSYKDTVVASIENSDYNADVINACFTGAEDNNYRLEIILYGSGGGSVTLDSAAAAPGHAADAVKARVFLKYDVDFFGKKFEKSVQGTAK